jgi:NitT/TauT family transport system substrate-binding protein
MTYMKAFSRAATAAFVVLSIQSSHVEAADDVTFVTDFGFNGRHAYYYVALEKGYYKDAGINV